MGAWMPLSPWFESSTLNPPSSIELGAFMPAKSLPVVPVIKQIDADFFSGSVKRLSDLLRIPSISTDPAYNAETRRAGQWCTDQLKSIGFDSSLRKTKGHPMVVAHFNASKGRSDRLPHIL